MSIKVSLISRLCFLFLAALASLYPAVALYVDVVVLKIGVSEVSVTEVSQEMLLLLALCFFAIELSRDCKNGFLYLVVGFFMVLLIRELDVYLDKVVHGFWLYPALIVTACAIYKAWVNQGETIKRMVDFIDSKGGIYVCIGLITILFFSRVIGTSRLWEPLMGDAYSHAFKSAIQEGIELYGYVIVFLGALLSFLATRQRDVHKGKQGY